MSTYKTSLFRIAIVMIAFVGISCQESDDVTKGMEVPETYEFMRNGESSVSYQGQTDRMNMLEELKNYIATSHNGDQLDENILLDMYANENSPFGNAELNTSTKNLESKTFIADVNFFKEELKSAAASSGTTEDAAQGKAGLIARSPGNNILVDEKGWEYVQIIEKGLMGAVFFNQIFNVYLSDSKIGNDVNNEDLVEGKNYTAMEHHWDEAFGYYGINPSFDTEGVVRFWGKYAYGRAGHTESAMKLKDAFLAGRTAIVNKDNEARDAARDILYKEFELVSAATAIHYINSGISDISNAATGELFHHISEAYAFTMALKYSPFKSITDEQIDTILHSNFGKDADFWTISVDGLIKARATLVEVYPSLAEVASEL
ncbi:MAG: DUF4856 domain-containing protein [Cyclobacteriaceae bacterium]